MFGINKLKDELKETKERVWELEFTINNPPEYKVGDEIKSGKRKGEVVTNISIRWHYTVCGYLMHKAYPEYWVYDSIKINK
jgi:hypothetical protein